MEPVNFFQAALIQPPPSQKAQMPPRKQGHASGHHGCHSESAVFPKQIPPPKNRFTRQGNADVVQKRDDEAEPYSVIRNVGG